MQSINMDRNSNLTEYHGDDDSHTGQSYVRLYILLRDID